MIFCAKFYFSVQMVTMAIRNANPAGCSQCLSFPHCQYSASLDLDTFPEIFLSAIIGNYDCEKGLLTFWGNNLAFIAYSLGRDVSFDRYRENAGYASFQ